MTTTLLTSDELDDMKDTQDSNLPETVYIQTLTETATATSGRSQAWNTTTTTTGRIATLGNSGEEREIASRLGSVQGYVVTLPADTAVTNQNRLQINGRQFEIKATLKRSSQTALRLVCVEVL
jgi:SPP1 family predicted phage head-tail adaptor